MGCQRNKRNSEFQFEISELHSFDPLRRQCWQQPEIFPRDFSREDLINLSGRCDRPTRSESPRTGLVRVANQSVQSNQSSRVAAAATRSCRSWRYIDRFKGVSRHARVTKAFHRGPPDLIARIRCCSPPPCVCESVRACVRACGYECM